MNLSQLTMFYKSKVSGCEGYERGIKFESNASCSFLINHVIKWNQR
jgi:hypothetical protein